VTSLSGRPVRVLIVGGGVAALEAMLALRHLAEERVSIELIAPESQFWYRPLAVAEAFGTLRVQGLDLTELARSCGASFSLGAVTAVDAGRRLARTASGRRFPYDALLVAAGAEAVAAVEGALTFRGPDDVSLFRALLERLESGATERVVFAVPGGVSWPLPAYELALTSAAFLAHRSVVGRRLAVVTPEEAPLTLFGASASARIAALLEAEEIRVHARSYPVAFAGGILRLAPGHGIGADEVVALPRLKGRPIVGIPRDASGFIPTDRHGRVVGLDDVYAAGDATAFPVKQGGLAAQQADAAAEAIAARAGAPLDPRPFRPVLRGLVLTGRRPAFLQVELARGPGAASTAETEPLWWPPSKIVGRYLAPFLAERAGATLAPPSDAETLPVSVDLERLAGVETPSAGGSFTDTERTP
jgi:sulfide:quinone oxidoreductase